MGGIAVMLEFHKLTPQIERMGEYFVGQEEDEQGKLALALELLAQYADGSLLPQIHERVQDAVNKDAGYRGAKPLDEPVADAYSPAPLPAAATIVATDGSQVPPDRHGAAEYYVINTGTIVFCHGTGEPPIISSDPHLFYESEYMHIEGWGATNAATVAARRTVAEMAALAEGAWGQRSEPRPLIALLDNPLLLIGMGVEVPDRDQLKALYFDAMTRLLDVGAGLAGYTDRPRSRYVVGLLHLMDLHNREIDITRKALSNDGRLEGLFDTAIYSTILPPGMRSALFVQMSPLNKEFKYSGGDTHEIAFFYMNVAAEGRPPKLARVEVPLWVTRDRGLIAEMQALIYHQCGQVVSRYPYVLTRAHELAIVKHDEARQLDTMVRVTLTRCGLETSDSEKQAGKNAVSGRKTRFEL
jgi:hypothetical protein